MSSESLFASVEGDGASAVALLHGFGDTHEAWSSVAGQLTEIATLIAFDLPGHGQSMTHPDAGRPKAAAGAVLAAVDRLGYKKVHLVGHSMGGAVAALAALLKPEAVASLTLLAPGGFGTEINHRLLAQYAEADSAALLRAALENMYGWNNPVSEATIERQVRMRSEPGQRDRLIDMARHLHRDGRQGVIPRSDLATLQVPVKVVWGTQDRVLPTRQSHHIPALFAAHVFEDTGHMLPAEIPNEVVALIKQNIR